MGQILSTTGQRRYLLTGSTQAAFSLTAGRRVVSAAADPLRVFPIVDRDGHQSRGVEITFFGTGADDSTFDYRVWRVKTGRNFDPGVNEIRDCDIDYLGGGTATLSTALGAGAGYPITSSERIADTITWTPSTEATTPDGPMDKIQAVYGNSVAADDYSPAANVPGKLFIPELGAAEGIIVEFDLTGATLANCLIDAIR